ncbi:unnamed protein product [Diatraea saccharalis]|uniref:Uncharacterized protein n=1 Tax=Diatraea saccharalis TaxID=40085 RepID=A0A9N9QUY2_9NEOP|nr:unnamed protein product [Diatraea saccharalis]
MEIDRSESKFQNDRLQNIFERLSQCKFVLENEREELKKLRVVNSKLEVEIKEAGELEKSHRYHLQTSREMIENLQETVSQLMYLKRDVKKLKDELAGKDLIISKIEKEKATILQDQRTREYEVRNAHEKNIEDLKLVYEKKVQQIQNESDTQIAQFTCVIEELRSKIKEMEAEHRDKMNVVVLEYEEKIQRDAAQITQLQEQLARQAARTDSNIDAYRRRLEELEEKLKQNHFKQYLAHNAYTSQYENQVERPYSVNQDPYPEACPIASIDKDIYEGNKGNYNLPASQNKPKPGNTLQVMYYGNKPPSRINEKKGQFNITKKRKLYNDKDFQDF